MTMLLELDESLSADVRAQAKLRGLAPEELLTQIVRSVVPRASEPAAVARRREAILKLKELRKGSILDLNGKSANKVAHEGHKY